MKKTLPLLIIVVFLGGMVWLGYALIASPHVPDVETGNITEIQKFMASDDFKELSLEDRASYVERYRLRTRALPREERREMFRSEALSGDERRQMFQNMGDVREQQMLAEAKRYFALDESQREAFLEQKIDEMSERWGDRRRGPRGEGEQGKNRSGETRERRGEGGPRGEGGGRRGRFGRRNMDPDRMVRRRQTWLSEHKPEDRAYLDEYRRVLRQAMRKARERRG